MLIATEQDMACTVRGAAQMLPDLIGANACRDHRHAGADRAPACPPWCSSPPYRPCSWSLRKTPRRSGPPSSRKASCRPPSNCAGGFPASPTIPERESAPGRSPAGHRRPRYRPKSFVCRRAVIGRGAIATAPPPAQRDGCTQLLRIRRACVMRCGSLTQAPRWARYRGSLRSR